MFGLGMTELIVILIIVVLIFGPKRLKTIGSDLGTAIKGFRKAVTEEEPRVIEGEVNAAQKTETKQDSNV